MKYHWNYRIIRYANGAGVGLHEVYYEADGSVDGWTEAPIGFAGGDRDDIIKDMERALADVKRHPILDEPLPNDGDDDPDDGTIYEPYPGAFDDAKAREVERLRAEVERLRAVLAGIEEDGTAEHNEAVALRSKLAQVLTVFTALQAEGRTMSLYNLLNGVSPATLLILPMLGRHPDEYPRFRDCFIGDPGHPETEGKIIVYTRTGGGNRDSYADENRGITEMPGYLFDYDDDFDCTFACFVFDVPSQWKTDFDKIVTGKMTTVSDEYVAHVGSIYPKIVDNLRALFRPDGKEDAHHG